MFFLARISKKNILAPEKKGLAPELFLIFSTPGRVEVLEEPAGRSETSEPTD
jgi:hypothetical protein